MATRPVQTTLNGICPYFTMFPLDFPLNILRGGAEEGDYVLDPFCGRGTTNFAARLAGLSSMGVDSSPVAAAVTASKLVTTSIDEIIEESQQILIKQQALQTPTGEFWQWAYHPATLDGLCRFREAFLEDCSTSPRIALRGILLGALHGPMQKVVPSYLSNQSPRTYAPKPAYAIRYWQTRGLSPKQVDIQEVVVRRAKRYYGPLPDVTGISRLGDSRNAETLQPEHADVRFTWVITSPPYYGMRTYIPDQWLRNWFLGGTDSVDYTSRNQIVHYSPDDFAADLRRVWRNVAAVCANEAIMVIRFGGIADRRAHPLDLITNSLKDSGWRVTSILEAGSATEGKRQANAFLRKKSIPMAEHDIWTIRE